jgi:beta-galactosidase
MKNIMVDVVKTAGLWGTDQQLAFPVITKSGINQNGKTIHYYFNYAVTVHAFNYPFNNGKELLTGETVAKNKMLQLAPWGVIIVEEN